MTDEDLGCKPGVGEKAKSDYSPLGKVFKKTSKESDNKEGLLKKLKNIEGKNKEQLDKIEWLGEKQLNVINKQGKKQLEAINKQAK